MRRLTKKQIKNLLSMCCLADAAADEIADGTPWERAHAREVHAGTKLVRKIIEENQAPAKKNTGKKREPKVGPGTDLSEYGFYF